jgi:hypothetical protein
MHLYLLLLIAACGINHTLSLKLSRWIASVSLGFSSIVATSAHADMIPSPWDANVKYEVVKEGKAGSPTTKVGDLVAIRFKGRFDSSILIYGTIDTVNSSVE